MANTVYHPASSRGFADHGWLKSHQTFSFSGYFNPERIQFGALRVLNDDLVDGGRGFGKHPHDNMEIISIPLEGELKHQDSMGNEAVIKAGEVQVMSAGTGIFHTEFNHDPEQAVKFLQIWLFPNKRNVTPRYDQQQYQLVKNQFSQILSPNADDEGVWIYQNAWFNLGEFDGGQTVNYTMHDPENGLYVFMINGSGKILGQEL